MKKILLFLGMSFNSGILLAENAVTFEATGNPGFLTIEGKGGKVSGQPILKDGKASGKFEVELKKLDSGIDSRNVHMREKYLEVDKFPLAVFDLDPVSLPKSGYFNWTGKLTLHGVTNKISGVGFIDGKQIEAKFSIKTPDFKIKKATYLGVGLDDKISIVARFDYPS